MEKNMQYYLSRGFDKRTAEYYISGRKKIVHAAATDNFQLILDFDNGETRIYDCNPLIEKGGVFSALSSSELFRRVYLDDDNSISWDINPFVDSSIHWNNKLDISPDTCYLESVPYNE